MPIIINPGTEGRCDATLANAETIVDRICQDLKIDRASVQRLPANDGQGRYGFIIHVHGKGLIEIEVPGDDPEEFLSGTPWVSRRMYVDGSSWLYQYGLNIMRDRLEGEP